MNTLHPHWRSTDKEEQAIPVHCINSKKESTATKMTGGTVSRKPAALLGMLLVTAMGVVFFQGVSKITGQLTDDNTLIRITDEGVYPPIVTVKHGATIQWTNEQSIPHIIASKDLCNGNGDCLYTPIIFQSEYVTFDITNDIPPGTYTYYSETAAAVNGQIVVTGLQGSQPATVAQDSYPADVFEEDDPTTTFPDEYIPSPDVPSAAPPLPVTFATDPGSASITTTTQNIPVNPNTVKRRQLNGLSTETAQNGSQHGGAPPLGNGYKPFRQPETGAATTLIVFALSVIGIFWMTRWMFNTISGSK